NSGSSLTSSAVLTQPAGTASGDLLVAHLSGSGSMVSGGITPPSGWTALYAPTSGGFSNDENYATYYKVAGAAEPSTYTWTFGSACVAAVVMVCVTGTNGVIRSNRNDLAGSLATTFTSSPLFSEVAGAAYVSNSVSGVASITTGSFAPVANSLLVAI